MRIVLALMLGASLVAANAQAAAVAEEGQQVVVVHKELPAFTLQQACCSLTNLPPGQHQITFIHPYTCCPVTVCFCLPCGCYRLECGDGLCAEKLTFSYPGLFNDVVIKFKKNGSVVVNK